MWLFGAVNMADLNVSPSSPLSGLLEPQALRSEVGRGSAALIIRGRIVHLCRKRGRYGRRFESAARIWLQDPKRSVC